MTTHRGKFQCTDHRVAARPAAELLAKYSTITWFCLDVEGAEMFILRAWDWDKPPRIERWSIESNKLDRAELVQFMASKGYTCEHIDGLNTFCELDALAKK